MIRDNRKIDASGRPKSAGGSAADPGIPAQAEETVQAEATMGQPGTPDRDETPGKVTQKTTAAEGANEGANGAPGSEAVAGDVVTGEVASGEPGPSMAAPAAPPGGGSAEPDPVGAGVAPAKVEQPAALGAELEALRSELDERVKDLQRVSAEYANYRKRVDRDRSAVVEQSTALVITSLLPILDDLDRAREHDDLVGPFAAVAEQLNAALAKFGLTGFGEAGDRFDPTRHEAVAHETSAEVKEPTCIAVMRRGYLLGDRLLRAALVSVADPE